MKKDKIILVVDDQADDRFLTRLMLESNNFKVIEAGTWDEALQKLDQIKPSIMVIDLEMPEGNASGLVKRIRQYGIYKDIPIILYSCYLDGADKRAYRLNLDVDAVITKLSHPEDLLNKVKELLALLEFN